MNHSGDFVAWIVRAYREDNGAFVGQTVSNASDGTWSITTDGTSKHYAVAFDSGGDYYWSETGLYLPFSSDLNDVSTTQKTVTAVGNAQFSSARSPFGGGSLLLDGTGDYAVVTDHADLQFGTGAFAIEMQFYINSYPGSYFSLASKYLNLSNRWSVYLGNSVTNDSGIRVAFNGTIVAGNITGTASLSSLGIVSGAWHYLGVFRNSSGLVYCVFNSTILPLSSTNSTNISLSGYNVEIGAQGGASTFNGNFAHFRLTKGGDRKFAIPHTEAFPTGSYSPEENALVYRGLTPA